MSSNCPACGALLTGQVCLSCGYRSSEEVHVAEPDAAMETTQPVDETPAAEAGARSRAEPDIRVDVDGSPPPWERRSTLGFFQALWTTWRDSVFRPVPFFRWLEPAGPAGPALAYYTLVSAVGIFFLLYWSVLETILGGGLSNLPTSQLGLQVTPGEELTLIIAGSVVNFVFLVVLAVVGLLIGAAVVHAGFAVVGAGRQGFGGTFRGLAYSAGPVVFTLFPFFGGLISVVWASVLVFIAMREVQRTSNGRAVLGFLMPLLGLFLLMFLFAFIIGLILSTADIGPVA